MSDFVRTQVLGGTDQPSLAKIESKLNELAQTAQQIASAVRRFEEFLSDPEAYSMAITKPRNRLLIFRLTQEEYATLQAASSEKGARSLSEFARAQLFGSLDAPALGQQLGELKTTVTRIAQMLEGN